MVFNIGYIGKGEYKTTDKDNPKGTKCYNAWKGMLRRCYDKKYIEKKPTYEGAKVCTGWHDFQNFAKWYGDNFPYHLDYTDKLCLDKDLISNTKVYSPNTCIFIPNSVNLFISKNRDGYVGTSFNKQKNKYVSRIQDFNTGKSIYIGAFININDGNIAYKKARSTQVENVKEYMRKLGYNEDIIGRVK